MTIWAWIAKNKIISIIFIVIIFVLTITTIIGGFIFGWLMYLNYIRSLRLRKIEIFNRLYKMIQTILIKFENIKIAENYNIFSDTNEIIPIKLMLNMKDSKEFYDDINLIFKGKKGYIQYKSKSKSKFDFGYKYIAYCILIQYYSFKNIHKLFNTLKDSDIPPVDTPKEKSELMEKFRVFLPLVIKLGDLLDKYKLNVINKNKEKMKIIKYLNENTESFSKFKSAFINNEYIKKKGIGIFNIIDFYIDNLEFDPVLIAKDMIRKKNIGEYFKVFTSSPNLEFEKDND